MKKVIRHESPKLTKIEREADRQRELKQLLINVRNGAMITPVIYKIEQMYGEKIRTD